MSGVDRRPWRVLVARCVVLALLCVTSRGLAQDAPAPDPNVDEARRRFQQGVALARAGNCSAALAELEASFRLAERASTLFNIAACQEDLHRYDLAVRDYERFLAIAPPDAAERPTADATLRALRNLLGTLRVTSNVEAEVWLGDRIVGRAPGEVLVPGGRHALEIRADGYLPVRREVEVTARAAASLEVTLEQAEQTIEQHIDQTIEQHVTVERPPLSPTVFWTGVGLTSAALLTGGVFGFRALSLRDDEENRPDLRVPPDTAPIRSSALIADVAFVSGGVLLAGTVIIAFLTDWDGADDAAETRGREQTEARLRPFVGPQSGGFGVEGRF